MIPCGRTVAVSVRLLLIHERFVSSLSRQSMASLLPDELLLQIFECCRAEDLCALSLVCTSWRFAQSVFFSKVVNTRAKADLLISDSRFQDLISDTLFFVSDRYKSTSPCNRVCDSLLTNDQQMTHLKRGNFYKPFDTFPDTRA